MYEFTSVVVTQLKIVPRSLFGPAAIVNGGREGLCALRLCSLFIARLLRIFFALCIFTQCANLTGFYQGPCQAHLLSTHV